MIVLSSDTLVFTIYAKITEKFLHSDSDAKRDLPNHCLKWWLKILALSVVRFEFPCSLHASSYPVVAQPWDSSLFQWKQTFLHFFCREFWSGIGRFTFPAVSTCWYTIKKYINSWVFFAELSFVPFQFTVTGNSSDQK